MNERILEIKELINQRKMLEVKSKLEELNTDLEKLDGLQKFHESVKKLVEEK